MKHLPKNSNSSNNSSNSNSNLQGYFDAPNKTYRDYRSQQSIYNFGARVMKVLGLERGGKR